VTRRYPFIQLFLFFLRASDAWWNKRAEADGSKDDYSGGAAAAEGEGHARQQRWKRSVGLSDFGKVTGAYI
jgi:hypothetical protein